MADVLDRSALRSALAELPGWDGDTTAIRKTVKAPDFPTAIRIVDEIAEAAEERNHHPDIDIRWRNLHFTLATHSAGGVTQADLDLARTIDAAAERHAAD